MLTERDEVPVKLVKTKKTKGVGFRISKDLYKSLEEYALTQKDDLEQPLSPPLAARRLFQKALKEAISVDTAKGNIG